ncbi:MAG: hypothetical protein N3E51_01655 [Candidatus Micrarchaeota archaeon]|nr:hypothetical protein [Candidatus Micrarchaeota archaeon]
MLGARKKAQRLLSEQQDGKVLVRQAIEVKLGRMGSFYVGRTRVDERVAEWLIRLGAREVLRKEQNPHYRRYLAEDLEKAGVKGFPQGFAQKCKEEGIFH